MTQKAVNKPAQLNQALSRNNINNTVYQEQQWAFRTKSQNRIKISTFYQYESKIMIVNRF